MKRILSIVLAVIMMVLPLSVSTIASGDNANYDDLVAPCYDNVTTISAGITKGSLGFVTCTSHFKSVENGKTFVMTCYLQRTDGSDSWANYKSTSETYSGAGGYTISKNWFAPAGYAYRTYTKVQVKNSAGTVIETITTFSATLYK